MVALWQLELCPLKEEALLGICSRKAVRQTDCSGEARLSAAPGMLARKADEAVASTAWQDRDKPLLDFCSSP